MHGEEVTLAREWLPDGARRLKNGKGHPGGIYGSSNNLWSERFDEFCEFCCDREALCLAMASEYESIRFADQIGSASYVSSFRRAQLYSTRRCLLAAGRLCGS